MSSLLWMDGFFKEQFTSAFFLFSVNYAPSKAVGIIILAAHILVPQNLLPPCPQLQCCTFHTSHLLKERGLYLWKLEELAKSAEILWCFRSAAVSNSNLIYGKSFCPSPQGACSALCMPVGLIGPKLTFSSVYIYFLSRERFSGGTGLNVVFLPNTSCVVANIIFSFLPGIRCHFFPCKYAAGYAAHRGNNVELHS